MSSDFETTLATIEDSSDSEVWELVSSAGADIASDLGLRRLQLGAIAAVIRTRYGQRSMGKLATEINEAKARLYEYRGVVVFYGGYSACADILAEFPTLSYSHLRTAKRLGEMDKAWELLSAAAGNAWTVEQTMIELQRAIGKPAPPLKLLDLEAPFAVAGDSVTFTFEPGAALELAQAVGAGEMVHVKIYEVKE